MAGATLLRLRRGRIGQPSEHRRARAGEPRLP